MKKSEQIELKEIWRQRITAFDASGESKKKWCENNGLKDYQLRYWIKKLKSEEESKSPSNQWISIEMNEQNSVSSDELKVKIGEITLEVRAGFNPTLLSDVVKVLIPYAK